MKKNSFMEGALIATSAIVFTKIIGLFYVIPFVEIIGVKGSILYGYAYSIYAIFLSLSIGGIPIAISKIISEYNALGYYYTKEKAYKIGATLIVSLGVISFLLLLVFAPNIARLILGDLKGGNTIEDVSRVIRIVATALLIVPLFSVTRGYLQGHKFIYPTSISNVIEQLVRVLIMIFGSYLVVNVFHLSINTAVGLSVFAATIGALVGYFYIFDKIRKNKENLFKNQPITREEARISTKDLTKKIIMYAFPFILIDLLKSAYNMVDTFTIVKTMTALNHSDIAELTVGVITNFGPKLNMIIISISIGITVSLIPNIASSFVKKNFSDISVKINQTMQTILFIGLPMTIGLYFLVQPIWVVFYGFNSTSIDIFRIYIFQALAFSCFSILISVFQTMNNFKVAVGTLMVSFLAKLFLNVPLMNLFDHLGINAYHAPNVLTILIYFIAIVFLFRNLRKNYSYSYKLFLPNYIKIVLSSLVMLVSLLLFNLLMPIDSITKSGALIEIIAFGIIGVMVYVIVVFRNNLVYDVFGEKFVNKILSKLHLNRK